jgi:hypothetical protein
MAAVHLTTGAGAAQSQWRQVYTQPAPAGATTPSWRTVGLDVTTAWRYWREDNLAFIASSDIGLARSQDGANWTYVDLPRGGGRWNTVYDLTRTPGGGRLWAAVASQHDIPHESELRRQISGQGAVLVSDDDGRTWPTSLTPGGGGPVTALRWGPLDGRLYAAVWRSGVYAYDLSTASWSRIDSNPSTMALDANAVRIGFDRWGRLYCVVAADLRSGFAPGGLYRYVELQGTSVKTWQKVTGGLEQLLSSMTPAAGLNPAGFAMQPWWPERIWVCTATVRGSNGGGGVYVYEPSSSAPDDPGMGTWTQVKIPFSAAYNDTVQVSGVWFDPISVMGNYAFAASPSHGLWFTDSGAQPPGRQQWEEIKAIPFLGVQSLTFGPGGTNDRRLYLSTFGGGVWGPVNPNEYVFYGA